MAEIELVIKIDEKYLESIHKAVEVDCTTPPYFVVRNLWESVLNGTPLPKGHGRLIDADNISFSQFFDAGDYALARRGIYEAPTIIEGSES